MLLGAVFILMILIGLYRYSLINTFIWNLIDAYLTFLEGIADRLLNSIESEVRIQNHQVYIGQSKQKWDYLLPFTQKGRGAGGNPESEWYQSAALSCWNGCHDPFKQSGPVPYGRGGRNCCNHCFRNGN